MLMVGGLLTVLKTCCAKTLSKAILSTHIFRLVMSRTNLLEPPFNGLPLSFFSSQNFPHTLSPVTQIIQQTLNRQSVTIPTHLDLQPSSQSLFQINLLHFSISKFTITFTNKVLFAITYCLIICCFRKASVNIRQASFLKRLTISWQ